MGINGMKWNGMEWNGMECGMWNGILFLLDENQ